MAKQVKRLTKAGEKAKMMVAIYGKRPNGESAAPGR
jgi:hypothetical protein